MNCLDCNNPTVHVAAVAVCHDCGAGICADHAVTEIHDLTRTVGLGLPVAVEPPGRIIRCNICARADDAVTEGHRRSMRDRRRRRARNDARLVVPGCWEWGQA